MENKEQLCSVVVVSKMSAENIEASRETAEKMIELTRKEEGNIRYDWYTDVHEAGTGVGLEQYKNMEAFQAHVNSEHMKEFGPKFKEWVSAPPVLRILKPFNVAPKYQMGDENSVSLVYVVKAKEEMKDDQKFKTMLARLVKQSRSSKGNLRYDIFHDAKEAGIWIFMETYATKEAFDFHIKTADYVKDWQAEIKNWQIGEYEVRILKPVSVAKR